MIDGMPDDDDYAALREVIEEWAEEHTSSPRPDIVALNATTVIRETIFEAT